MTKTIILFLLGLSFFSFSAMAEETGTACVDTALRVIQRNEHYAGKPLLVREILNANDGTHPYRVNIAELLGRQEEVILGFEGRHWYLYVGGVKYDGELMGLPVVREGANTVPQGVMFHFRDLPESSIEKMKTAITQTQKRKTVTCVNGACHILEQGGIRFGDGRGPGYLPARTTRRIMAQGLTGPGGESITFDIYASSSETVEQAIAVMNRDGDRSFWIGGGGLLLFGGPLAAEAVYVVVRPPKKKANSSTSPPTRSGTRSPPVIPSSHREP